MFLQKQWMGPCPKTPLLYPLHILGIYWAYLGHILGTSWTSLAYSGILWHTPHLVLACLLVVNTRSLPKTASSNLYQEEELSFPVSVWHNCWQRENASPPSSAHTAPGWRDSWQRTKARISFQRATFCSPNDHDGCHSPTKWISTTRCNTTWIGIGMVVWTRANERITTKFKFAQDDREDQQQL